MRRFFFSWEWLLLPAFLVAFVFFFGEVKIEAVIDGRPLKGAVVKLDNKVVGKTPYSQRFMVGTHKFEIIPPDDIETVEKKYQGTITSVLLGTDVTARFETPPSDDEE